MLKSYFISKIFIKYKIYYYIIKSSYHFSKMITIVNKDLYINRANIKHVGEKAACCIKRNSVHT